ncbi:MAG: phytanoyl-CoA dioxygenase [Rhodospirillaceae bacterium]|jgi:hypothetical protein|nr:phytanoyl-CoA dioxygenase [Rhodospirillaceae bacterium]MBT4042016.1 phytanoyl-CoA dioxygenase [Rhodospirillaceae bacterium]MBT4690330.1 phytanoyl-CoA dioxygenase [Rhodospirillaceae bacterium]MBT5079310.1 phytanoyl-CoA dioxygenase [Rhodospirillaceae bacterium]MBT5525786.1 phytanoyl-CoA dioxygenase [Rhodospirillaceae bacterium]
MPEHERYHQDGVVKLTDALDARSLAQVRTAYEWSLNNLGPHGKGGDWLSAETETFEDKANPGAPEIYEGFLRQSGLAGLARDILRSEDLWFMYEQVFKKAGGCRRTPWHQDGSYLAVDGDHLIVFWISFAAVPKAEALEFVVGSHQGPLYNGSTFNIDDPTEPIYPDDTLPRLPDIDARQRDFDIVSWATEPGDIIAFHPNLLHGGGATMDRVRETVSLRFFGDDAVYAPRPGPCGPRIAGLHDALTKGDAFRYPAFLKL